MKYYVIKNEKGKYLYRVEFSGSDVEEKKFYKNHILYCDERNWIDVPVFLFVDEAYYIDNIELQYIKNSLKRVREDLNHQNDIVFTAKFSYIEPELNIIQVKAVDSKESNESFYRIKDIKTGKYFAGNNKFDEHGKIYNNRHGAEIALSKKSKSKKSQRKSKSGMILFSNKDYVNCKVVPCKLIELGETSETLVYTP